jgi:hypothetical protein
MPVFDFRTAFDIMTKVTEDLSGNADTYTAGY